MVFAEEKSVDIPVSVKTNNNTLTISIQGGNSYNLNCANNQEITQTLQTRVNVTPGNIQECQDDVDKLSSTFVTFTQQFNKTIGDQNCLDTLSTNKVLSSDNNALKDKVKTLEDNQEDKDAKFYDMWQTCDTKRSELQISSGQNTACQQQLGEYKTQLDNSEKNKWLYYAIACAIGAGLVYAKGKIKTEKGPDEDLGR